jgi:hypothetical protein
MRWFRLWSELIDDPKICNMDEKTFRIFILLMCLAAEREKNGEIDLSEKDVAWRLRIAGNALTRARRKLEALSILLNDNGNMTFLNWEKRQFRSDCSTERVKRFRNVACNRIETPPETETETETEEKNKTCCPSDDGPRNGNGSSKEFLLTRKKRKLTGKRLESFLQFWDAFGYKTGRAQAADSWLDIPQLTNKTLAEIIDAAQAEARRRPDLISSGRTPIMAQGWITGRRWEDEHVDIETDACGGWGK